MVPRNAAAMRPRLPKALVDNPLDVSNFTPLPFAAGITTTTADRYSVLHRTQNAVCADTVLEGHCELSSQTKTT